MIVGLYDYMIKLLFYDLILELYSYMIRSVYHYTITATMPLRHEVECPNVPNSPSGALGFHSLPPACPPP